MILDFGGIGNMKKSNLLSNLIFSSFYRVIPQIIG